MFHLCYIFEFIIDSFDNGSFPEKQLVETDINAPFMLLFNLVISCIPSTNSLTNRFLPIYPLSSTNFPQINSTKDLYSRGLRSSKLSGIIMKFKSSPRSLHMRYNLNPKNRPMEHLPLCAIPLNVLWIWILWFLHTRKGCCQRS